MNIFSPAKINLALNVGRVQSNGYHPVDSVLHMLEYGDVVSVELADELSVTCSLDLGISQEDNLAYKAVKKFDETFGTTSHVAVHIDKHIMAGGGLGGGSSNAAAVLLALCHLHGVSAHDERLLKMAGTLGADVPVFLAPTGASLMTHYGEKLEASLTPAPGVPIVVAWPIGAHSSTAEVYRTFDEAPVRVRSMANLCDYLKKIVPTGKPSFDQREALTAMRAQFLADELYNNLSEAAIQVTPEVGDVLLNLLAQPQTLGATVSGSGACSFAITASSEEAHTLAAQCEAAGFGAVATRLRARGVSKTQRIESLHE